MLLKGFLSVLKREQGLNLRSNIILVVIGLGLLGLLGLFQSADHFVDINQLKKSKVQNPFLYKISRGGKTSVILGTRHLGLRLEQFPQFVKNEFLRAQIFLGEDIETDEVKPRLSRVAKFENANLNTKTRRALEQRGMDLQKFNRQDEELKICLRYIFWEASPEWSKIDRELEREASKHKKQIIALDSSTDVTRAVEQAAAICDANALVSELSPSAARQRFVTNYRDYLLGNERLLIPDQEIDKMLLISERNFAWLPKILEAHSQGDAFIAVGALHLGGENGLLELLKRDGFKIQRIAGEESDSPAPLLSWIN